MKVCVEKMAERRLKRFYKFRTLKNLPDRKVFRESRNYMKLIILFFIVTGVSLSVNYYTSDFLGLSLAAYMAAIVLFGYALKLTLSLLFPVVVLNKKGIQFFNSKAINWSEIKSIKVSKNKNAEQVVYLTKLDSKIIKKNLEDAYFPTLQIYARSFLRKYKTKVCISTRT